jgi:hypothetical protein
LWRGGWRLGVDCNALGWEWGRCKYLFMGGLGHREEIYTPVCLTTLKIVTGTIFV